MKKLPILLLLILFMGGCMGNDRPEKQTQDFNLDDYKWKKRITITYADSAENSDYKNFKSDWDSAAADVNDRDLILIELFDDSPNLLKSEPLSQSSVDGLMEKYDLGDNPFEVILIGKDGTVKLRETRTTVQYIFDLIDTMPMRQQEMRSE